MFGRRADWDPIELATEPRDSKRERKVTKWLIEQPEAERYAFITKVIGENPHLGLNLVPRCQLSRESLTDVLEQGLKIANASSVKWWLEAVVHGLGFKRTLKIVEEQAAEEPRIGQIAVYWLLTHRARRLREMRARVQFLRKDGAANALFP